MNLFKNVDLKAISEFKTDIANDENHDKSMTQGVYTGKSDFFSLDGIDEIQSKLNVEENKRLSELQQINQKIVNYLNNNDIIVSNEDLSPLDKDNKALRDPKRFPPNVFVSRFINKEGTTCFRLYMDHCTDIILPYILYFLETLTDEVEVIFELSGMNLPLFNVLSLLSTMKSCKAKITTVANIVLTLPDLAVWLSGDEITYTDIAFIMVQNNNTGTKGTIDDVDVHIRLVKRIQDKIISLIKSKKILSEDNFKKVFENNGIEIVLPNEIEQNLKI